MSASIYNSPDPSQATLVRNDGAEFPKLAEAPLAGPAARGNRLSLKTGAPELLCLLVHGDKADTLHVEDLGSGKPVAVATADNLPAGSDYAFGNFRGSPLRDFIFYKPGENSLTVRPVEESAPGQFQFGKAQSFDLGQPVRRVIALDENGGKKLFIIFGQGEKAGVFDFDGAKAPVLAHSLAATNEFFTCAAAMPGGLIVFSAAGRAASSRRATRLSRLTAEPTLPDRFGGLASLADNDNITIPDIYARITAKPTATNESQMTALHQRHPRHAGELCHAAHSWRRVRHGQPGQ